MSSVTQTPSVLLDEVDDVNEVFMASQRTLIWWRFRKHKLALISAIVIIAMYLMAIFADFVAPYTPNSYSASHQYAPPMQVHFLLETEDGTRFIPHVFAYNFTRDPVSLKQTFEPDPDNVVTLQFFAPLEEPRMFLGMFEIHHSLFGASLESGERFHLLGADKLGRDVLSRVIYGAQLSLSIGLFGVFISLFLGILLGGLSGLYGGVVDNIIQRVIEFVVSLPSIPLWLGLSAALPPQWSVVQVYLFITIILSLRGWTGLARVVRGKFLALRSEEFVMAAQLDGSRQLRLIFRHMLPSFTSHIIASLTLAIPSMIIGETALSFLGLGLRPPAVSWGVLLQDAQAVNVVISAPWLLLPAVAVTIAVMAFNFFGDGLRDAADPYGR